MSGSLNLFEYSVCLVCKRVYIEIGKGFRFHIRIQHTHLIRNAINISEKNVVSLLSYCPLRNIYSISLCLSLEFHIFSFLMKYVSRSITHGRFICVFCISLHYVGIWR